MRIGILTVSDACAAGQRDDLSGSLLLEWAAARGFAVTRRDVIADESLGITRTLVEWADSGELDAIVTTGGTGFGPRDVTPEATRPAIDREAPGIAERLRRSGEPSTRWAPLSRGLAGSRGPVAIVNLPGSPGGVRDALDDLASFLPHMTALLRGDVPSHDPASVAPGGTDA